MLGMLMQLTQLKNPNSQLATLYNVIVSVIDTKKNRPVGTEVD